jgi:hypothetical protein
MPPQRERLPTNAVLAFVVVCALFAPRADAQGGRLAAADEPPPGLFDEIVDSTRGGRFWVELRPRFEHVEVDGFARDADAFTLRSAIGVETARWRGLALRAEVENTTHLGQQRFFDGIEGPLDRPTVRDAENLELDRLAADFLDDSGFGLEAGRFVYVLGDGRLVGDDPWRQDRQTFDGAVARASVLGALDVEYAWLARVNRVLGDEAPNESGSMATHVVRVGHTLGAGTGVAVYFVDSDIDDDPTRSSATLGARFDAAADLAVWTSGRLFVDLARQRESAANPVEYDASYTKIGGALTYRMFELALGVESFGGGSAALGDEFTTPLGSPSSFNGGAEVFVTGTPDGLVDRFASLRFTRGAFDALLSWHGFTAERGGADFGTELDLEIAWQLHETLSLGLLLTDYDADTFAVDSRSAALWLTFAP